MHNLRQQTFVGPPWRAVLQPHESSWLSIRRLMHPNTQTSMQGRIANAIYQERIPPRAGLPATVLADLLAKQYATAFLSNKWQRLVANCWSEHDGHVIQRRVPNGAIRSVF